MPDIENSTFEELFDGEWDEEETPPEGAEETEDQQEEETEEVVSPDDEDEEEVEDEEDSDDDDDDDDEEPDKEEKTDEEPRTFTVQVDGEEIEVDEEELVRGYATAKSSTQRFQESKALHDEASTFFKSFLESPGDALTDLVANKIGDRTKARERVRDAFLEFLAPDLEESMIEDEKERELYRRQRELDDRQKDIDRRQSAEASKKELAEEAAFVENLKTSISAGLKKHELPDKDEIWIRAGQLVDSALKTGTKRENISELMPGIMQQVAEERQEQAKKLGSTLTPEEFLKMFPNAAEALKKERIEKVKEKRSTKKPGKPGKKRKPEKILSMDDVFGS